MLLHSPVAPADNGAPSPSNGHASFYKSPGPPETPVTPKDELLQAILQHEISNICWILGGLARSRPELQLRYKRQGPEQNKVYQSDLCDTRAYSLLMEANAVDEDLEEDDALNHLAPQELKSREYHEVHHQHGLPIVQFASHEFYCLDHDEHITLEVQRTGNQEMRSEVQFSTEDLNAVAGREYIAATGTVVFEPGETLADVTIELKGVPTWEAELEFHVDLLSDEIVGATVGRQMDRARVRIIGTGTFPSSRFQEELRGGEDGIRRVPEMQLFLEYVKLLFSDPVIRTGTIKRCLSDQLHSVNFIAKQFIMIYLVNRVLNREVYDGDLFFSRSKQISLLMIVAVEIACLFLLHMFDLKRLTWSVGGPGRKMLHKALLRRFMCFDEIARGQVKEGDLRTAITDDVVVVIGQGYGSTMKLAGSLGTLLMIVVFKCTSPFIFGTPFSFTFFLPFGVVPLLFLAFMNLRAGTTSSCLAAKKSQRDRIVAYTSEAVSKYRLIRDYSRRMDFVQNFEPRIDGWNKANREANTVMLNNNYFSPWITMALVSAWTWFAGLQVISGKLSLGMFIADLNVLKRLGDEFGALYMLCMDIETVLPELQRITLLLNKPTDLVRHMVLEQRGLFETERRRRDLKLEGKARCLDSEPIVLENIVMTYGAELHRFSFMGRVEVRQGQMACFFGGHGEGKTTLMKMLGRALLPETSGGHFFIPSHLRVLHVSPEPLFFEGTVMDNLVFGVRTHSDGDRDRVQRIMGRLGNLDKIDLDSQDETAWQQVLTLTQRHGLNLVRALVANPHVLLLHKPTMVYSANIVQAAMKLLHDFVKSRGVEQDDGEFDLRTPRTCIWTIYRKQTIAYADIIYMVSSDGVKPIDKKTANEKCG